jgi:spore maturation protein CgeB
MERANIFILSIIPGKIYIPDINESKSCVILLGLGLGLGYELLEIEKRCVSKKNYVLDTDRNFYENIIQNEDIKHIVLDSKAVFYLVMNIKN